MINENISGSMKTLQDEIVRLKEELNKDTEKQHICENCKRKVSLVNLMGGINFQNTQSSVRNSMRKSMMNSQDLLKIQLKMEEEKNSDKIKEDPNESVDSVEKHHTKDEIKGQYIINLRIYNENQWVNQLWEWIFESK